MTRHDDWRPADGLVFEPNAMLAVKTLDDNVIVAAGPGAGKTELLAQRADFLLRGGLCPYPRRILAVSFKVDAARNLRERVARRSGSQLSARFDSFTFHAFAKRLIDNFRPALSGVNVLDADYEIHPDTRVARKQITFADLVPLALEIVETNEYARGGLRQTYSHVFLDEFQDCTSQQYRFINSAFGASDAVLTAVGDTKQRIMAWAGALDGVMQTFADDFEAKPLTLYQNFRSAPRLRRMQNKMVADMDAEAVSPASDLVGDEGAVDVFAFGTDREEAIAIAELIESWLDEGTPPAEIAILVRQQPHLVAHEVGSELARRSIAFRNEQATQDLTAEPIVALILNFIRVVADEGQSEAYAELMRASNRSSASEEGAARFDRKLKRMLEGLRRDLRSGKLDATSPSDWKSVVQAFLEFVSLPVLAAMSPGYQRGVRLEDLVEKTMDVFCQELAIDQDAVQALRRLSESDTVRVLTIHKCKGLEFEKVVVLGVEQELFWGNRDAAMSEYFVAISRAKQHLVLTHAAFRAHPAAATRRWDEHRTTYQTFLDYATDT